jgi:hypothetical protein
MHGCIENRLPELTLKRGKTLYSDAPKPFQTAAPLYRVLFSNTPQPHKQKEIYAKHLFEW